MIAKHSIDQVLETAQVEEVVSHFVNLKRRGVNMIGLCPFHNEKTPSFTVSPAKNLFKCFGCGKGGNAVHFVMEHEGYSFPEAIRFLAKMYNITLDETVADPSESEDKQKKDSLFIVTEFAKNHFVHNLFHTQAGVNIGMSYFRERGFRENTIKEFSLGFAPDDPTDLTEIALRNQYKKEFLVELGLCNENGRDFFRNRVIFPIQNLSGKTIGFGGRILGNDKKIAKYINSPESEIYNKRKTLYGLYFAKNDIRKEDSCILVEGYTDVISLHQAGIKNVVASSGTSLTDDQIRLIKRYTQNVTVIYDGDAAGIHAAQRGTDLILAMDMFVKVVILPEQHDPDSFIKKEGPNAFRTYLRDKAQDFILFKSYFLKKEINQDPVRKVAVLKDIVQTLSKIPDPMARNTYVKESSNIMDIDEAILINEVNKVIKNEIRQKRFRESLRDGEPVAQEGNFDMPDSQPVHEQSDFTNKADESMERGLISLLINFGNTLYDEKSQITVAQIVVSGCAELLGYFTNQVYASIFREVIHKTSAGEVTDQKYFTNHPDEPIRQLAIDLLNSPYVYAGWQNKGMELQTQRMPDQNFKNEADQLIIRINNRKLTMMIEENMKKLDKLDPEDPEYLISLKLHAKMIEQKKELANLIDKVIG
ncbi:MAG TPA: DNA primase [Saprospiraceae bacterium]|nr:DNA primase [Saprospiraceae bacterium]